MVKAQRFFMVLVAVMLLAGCSAKQPQVQTKQEAPPVQAQAAASQPQEKPAWFFHDIVDLEFVKPLVKVPRPENTLLIDSRPYQPKHVEGHIPTSVSIPDSRFEEMAGKLPQDKSALLVFYCEGPT
jgi:uncharacterized protein YceK